MDYWFYDVGEDASSFNANLNDLDVSHVTSMNHMLYNTGYSSTTWNIGDLSNWDTSKVINMNSMFSNAGYNATTFSINIPETNGGGISNTPDKLYGENTSTYATPPSGRSFTIMATK